MQFICSINNKVTGALDAISGKIEKGGDFTAFNQNWQKKELSSQEIANEVAQKKVYALGI